MKKRFFDWSPEAIETLRTLWAEGKSGTEIAAIMGGRELSRNAVIGKLHRLRVYRDGPSVRGTRKQRRTSVSAQRMADQREWKRQHREAERLAREQPELRPAPVTQTKTVEVVAPPSKRLTLLELPRHACRYIEDNTPPYTYCAGDTLPGKSWCEFHYGVVINKVSSNEANRRAARAANWR